MAKKKESPPIIPALAGMSEKMAARLMKRFLRDPLDPQPEPRLNNLSDEEEMALAKLLQTLGVSVETLQVSSEHQNKAINFLTNAITEGALSPARAEASGRRLGDAGQLGLSQYKLVFPDGAFKQFEELGDRRAYVERAVREAHAVQHLSNTGKVEGAESQGLSIFVRVQENSRGENYAHLVIAGREGKVLRFENSWRVFSSEVPWDVNTSPLEILKRFVERFGVPVELPNRLPSKFLLYDVIPFSGPNTWPEVMKCFKYHSPADHSLYAQMVVRLNDVIGALEVGMVFAIDTTEYMKSLNLRLRG